jgi:hypothetical protein
MRRIKFSSGISPELARVALATWFCMLVAICAGGYFLLSENKRDKEWCRAHHLAVIARTHPHVYCQDANGIRHRPGEYPVENSVWVNERPTAKGAPK